MDLYDVINYGVGASYVEVRWQRDVGTVAVLRNGVVEYVESYRQEGYGVRVLAGGGLGFAATTDADGLKTAVETAVKLARVGGRLRKRSIAFSEERLAKLRYSLPPMDLDPLEYLKNLDKVVENKVNVRRLFAAVWTTEKHIVTSDGADVYSKIPRAAVFAILIRHEPSLGSLQRFVARGGVSMSTLSRFEEELANEADKLNFLLEKSRHVSPGRYDVVFGPELTGILVHESIGHPFELDRIYGREGAEAGESYIRPGEFNIQVGSSLVNIVDYPAVPDSYGFYLVDDEGVVARPKYLVREGVASEFITNRQYAALAGGSSNGGARASAFDREPIPRMSNTYLLPGDWRPEEIIKDTKRGVYVVSYTEWNIDDIRYSGRYGILEGYLIENGELKEPVRGFVEVDTPELWGNVDAVGRDFRLYIGTCGKGNPAQGVPVTMGGPTFRSRSLRVV
ncbi:MAG: TldD/PmbA family protein [Pyrobaculum sp.]